MNTALFLQVADAIETHPERFSLDIWFYSPTKAYGDEKTGWWFEQLTTECDTTACVAGWVNALTRGVNAADTFRAARLLGVPEPMARARLFGAGDLSIWADVAHEYGWNVTGYGAVADWRDIEAHQAADVLRRVARGELTL